MPADDVTTLGVCVKSRLGALVTADPDAFRRLYCYCEPTCKVLSVTRARLIAMDCDGLRWMVACESPACL